MLSIGFINGAQRYIIMIPYHGFLVLFKPCCTFISSIPILIHFVLAFLTLKLESQRVITEGEVKMRVERKWSWKVTNSVFDILPFHGYGRLFLPWFSVPVSSVYSFWRRRLCFLNVGWDSDCVLPHVLDDWFDRWNEKTFSPCCLDSTERSARIDWN